MNFVHTQAKNISVVYTSSYNYSHKEPLLSYCTLPTRAILLINPKFKYLTLASWRSTPYRVNFLAYSKYCKSTCAADKPLEYSRRKLAAEQQIKTKNHFSFILTCVFYEALLSLEWVQQTEKHIICSIQVSFYSITESAGGDSSWTLRKNTLDMIEPCVQTNQLKLVELRVSYRSSIDKDHIIDQAYWIRTRNCLALIPLYPVQIN